MKRNIVKDWLVAISVCAIMLVVMALVGYGGWCLLIDSGRAIVH